LHSQTSVDPQCARWHNNLDACDGIVDASVCDNPQSTWTRGQLGSYYNWIFSSTAEKACRKQIMKLHPGEEDLALAVEVYPDWYYCYLDYDRDGSVFPNEFGDDLDGDGIDDVDEGGVSSVMLEDVTREPECELTPKGPYESLGTKGARGGSFSDANRRAIYDRNTTQHRGLLRSDAGPAASQQTGIGDVDQLSLSRWYYPPYNDDAEIDEPYQLPTTLTTSAQVDHIIPRIDIHGCACGTNAPSNAAVISGQLNRKMSNNLRDPDRIKMLQALVPGYVPPAGLEPESQPVDDHEIVNETGGCSTGDALGLGLLPLFGIVLACRSRRGRSRSHLLGG
jgi:hypothetical protein